MIPAFCGIDVCAFVQKSENTREDSFPKLVVSPDNRISIFQDNALLKSFKYGQVCNLDSQDDVLGPLAESVTKDVVEGINRIVFVYKLSGNDVTDTAFMMTICSFMLNATYAAVKSETSHDISLHVSCIEGNNKGIVDLMQKSHTTSSDVKVFELANQAGSHLVERIITDAKDIDKIVETVFQNPHPNKIACRHTIVSSIISLKIRNRDGFEVIKTGRFILVDIENCLNFWKEVGNRLRSRRESFYLNPDARPVTNAPKLWDCSLNGILKNFLYVSNISIMLTLPSTVFDMESIEAALETISEIQNLRIKPAIYEKLILRESLKDYADEIKALEKDLVVLKNNNGILISHQKYRSLKNRLLLSEAQNKDLREEGKVLKSSVTNKIETLSRLQQEIQLTSIKSEEEMKKLKALKVTLEETKQNNIDLNLKKMEAVDECVSMNDLTKYIRDCMEKQNSHLAKIKYKCEKSSSSARQLNADVDNYTITATTYHSNLKDKVNSLLLYLREILLNSAAHQNDFIFSSNKFHLKFDDTLKLWRQHCSSLIEDFLGFIEEISHNSCSLKNNLSSELLSLNFAEDMIIQVIKKNKVETLGTAMSYSTKINQSVENSIKSLYEVLCLLEISQGKIEGQLKRLILAICCHSHDRMKFLTDTRSLMASMYHYFNVQLDLSSKTNSDIFSHHQEMKTMVNEELMKIKEAVVSLKNLFCVEQKFATDKWRQRQVYLSDMKEISGISESLQQCGIEHPLLLDKLKDQSTSNIEKLSFIFKEQTQTVESLGSQIKKIFNEIESSIVDFSEENKKRINRQENDIEANVEAQNETISKCFNSTKSLIEDVTECITRNLQNIKNSSLNVQDLEENKRVNQIIFELRNNLHDYVKKYTNVFQLSEFTFQQFPKPVSKQTEILEESVEFNHEEILSSTPSSYLERPKNPINYKMNFLKNLKKIAAIQMNPGCLNQSCDLESIINASTMSLPSVNNLSKVEFPTSRSFVQRKVVKKS